VIWQQQPGGGESMDIFINQTSEQTVQAELCKCQVKSALIKELVSFPQPPLMIGKFAQCSSSITME
jgi:hypothetical protein